MKKTFVSEGFPNILPSFSLRERIIEPWSHGLLSAFAVFGRMGRLRFQGRIEGVLRGFSPLLKGDRDLVSDFYGGCYTLSGERVEVQKGSIFSHIDAGEAFLEELYGFSWLKHFQASGSSVHLWHARVLLVQWEENRGRCSPIAKAISVRARRLLSFVCAGSYLLQESDFTFRRFFFSLLWREFVFCASRLSSSKGLDHLQVAIACAYAVMGFQGLEAYRGPVFQALTRAIEAQIYPDGGHVSRSPEILLQLLLDLLPLHSAVLEDRMACPALHEALERMLPMLRFFIHGDDGLCAFHGVGDPSFQKVRAILQRDGAFGRPLQYAPHSSYGRLTQGSLLVIADMGGADQKKHPPVKKKYSSSLAFEFSDGPQRVVVNCGASSVPSWRDALAQAAAHSTVVLTPSHQEKQEGKALGSSWFSTWKDCLLKNPFRVSSSPGSYFPQGGACLASPEGHFMEAVSSAYVERFGLLMKRRLFLSSSGRDLCGEDRFCPDFDQGRDIVFPRFCLRFHLHPLVQPTLEGRRVFLKLPKGVVWIFQVDHGTLSLEESVYAMGSVRPRSTAQIVVTGSVCESDRLQWSFVKRISKAPRN